MFSKIKVNRWLNVFHPYRQLKLYLEDVAEIVHERQKGILPLSAKSKAVLTAVKLILALYIFKSAQYIALYVLEKTTQSSLEVTWPFWRLLHHDMMLYLDCPLEVNIFSVSYYFQIACFIFWSYWFAQNSRQLTPMALTYAIVFQEGTGSESYFLRSSKLEDDRPAIVRKVIKYGKLYYIPCRYCIFLFGKRKDLFKVLRKSFNTFFLLFLAFFCLYFHYLSFRMIFEADLLGYFFTTAEGLLALLYLLVSSLSYSFTFVWIAVENTVASSVMFIFSLIVLFRLKQVNTMLKSEHLRSHQFYRFTHYHTSTLLDILAGNRFTGVLILVHMLFIAPMNSYIMIGLLRSRFNITASVLFLSVAVFQYDGMIALHLLATLYTKAIHRCAHRLHRLMLVDQETAMTRKMEGIANGGRRNSIRRGSLAVVLPSTADRLHLMIYVEKFSCRRKYGITYGAFGLMSLYSFAKFVMLYTELLMFSYRLFI